MISDIEPRFLWQIQPCWDLRRSRLREEWWQATSTGEHFILHFLRLFCPKQQRNLTSTWRVGQLGCPLSGSHLHLLSLQSHVTSRSRQLSAFSPPCSFLKDFLHSSFISTPAPCVPVGITNLILLSRHALTSYCIPFPLPHSSALSSFSSHHCQHLQKTWRRENIMATLNHLNSHFNLSCLINGPQINMNTLRRLIFVPLCWTRGI